MWSTPVSNHRLATAVVSPPRCRECYALEAQRIRSEAIEKDITLQTANLWREIRNAAFGCASIHAAMKIRRPEPGPILEIRAVVVEAIKSEGDTIRLNS